MRWVLLLLVQVARLSLQWHGVLWLHALRSSALFFYGVNEALIVVEVLVYVAYITHIVHIAWVSAVLLLWHAWLAHLVRLELLGVR